MSIPYPSGHPFLHAEHGRGTLSVIVSIPYPSGHPFLRVIEFANYIAEKCVNPLSIGTPISTADYWGDGDWPNCVNPLSIGTPISTFSPQDFIRLSPERCQSPIHRDTHFYGKLLIPRKTNGEMCQSPIHRDTHFYAFKRRTRRNMEIVSIPYPSGHPFLPI